MLVVNANEKKLIITTIIIIIINNNRINYIFFNKINIYVYWNHVYIDHTY